MSLDVQIEKELDGFHLSARFTVQDGISGLLGASGSGKSMTLKCIAGFETPDEGRIVLNGRTLFDARQRVNLPPQRRRVGYLFQNYALFPNMTVQGNILCGLRRVPDPRERSRRLRETLRLFRLEDIASRMPHEISGGQAQRVALARILANRPEALLLDEPFSALDAHLRLNLQMELRDRLRDYGGPVLMVTHSRDEAYRMCEALAVADRGTLNGIRDTGALFADPGSRTAARITGCKNIARAWKLGEHEINVPEWNVRFRTERTVRDGLKGVAFRAHDLSPKEARNAFPVRYAGEMEEPFEWILLYRYAGQDGAPLWWRMAKEARPAQFPDHLGIAPAKLMLLYQ
ncbi:MAG: ATP-binding cassette domain-containing protein [Oscillibacter sp.]|nr:ATP-binding cassette domain-containing protein [Oscillibacter sp.]